MQTLANEYRSYLQAVKETPKNMFAAKFGLITFEILGSFSAIWTLFVHFWDVQSVVTMVLTAAYFSMRFYFGFKRNQIDLQDKRREQRRKDREEEIEKRDHLLKLNTRK